MGTVSIEDAEKNIIRWKSSPDDSEFAAGHNIVSIKISDAIVQKTRPVAGRFSVELTFDEPLPENRLVSAAAKKPHPLFPNQPAFSTRTQDMIEHLKRTKFSGPISSPANQPTVVTFNFLHPKNVRALFEMLVKDFGIKQEDINRLLEAAELVPSPPSRKGGQGK